MADRPLCSAHVSVVAAYVALAVGVLGMSAGGPIFALMRSVRPYNKAAWRLWMTAAMQFGPFCYTVKRLLDERKQRKAADPRYDPTSKEAPDVLARWFQHVFVLIAVGFFLAIHFLSWSWSVSNTSLTHSLLLVCSHPVLLVLFGWLLYGWLLLMSLQPRMKELFSKAGWKLAPPGLLETVGACVAMAGVVVMVGAVTNDGDNDDDNGEKPTVVGDLAALLGAATMGLYLIAGRHVRPWMPIWMYAFPVTLSAAVWCTFVATISEGARPDGHREDGWFGWADSARLGLLTVAAAGISGILGHTLANYALKQVPSLIVSISILGEALIGSIIGWLFKLNASPDMYTWIGGAVLLVGGVITIYGQNKEAGEKSLAEKRVMTESRDIPLGDDYIVELYGGT